MNRKCRRIKFIMSDLTIFMGMGKKMKRDISICSWGTLNPIHKEDMCYRKDEYLEVMETLLGALLQSSKQPACQAGRAEVPGPHTRSFILFSFALSPGPPSSFLPHQPQLLYSVHRMVRTLGPGWELNSKHSSPTYPPIWDKHPISLEDGLSTDSMTESVKRLD